MSIAWFICRHKKGERMLGRPSRVPAMNDFFLQIEADAGRWDGTEVLGGRIICKVRASDATIAAITGTPLFQRMPKDNLADSLSDLSTEEKNNLTAEMISMGRTMPEIQERFGNPVELGNYTLGDVLRLMAEYRRKPRYDLAAKDHVLDGEVQPCRPVDDVDKVI